MRINYSKQICLFNPLSFDFFTALKGTHFIVLFAVTSACVPCGDPKT